MHGQQIAHWVNNSRLGTFIRAAPLRVVWIWVHSHTPIADIQIPYCLPRGIFCVWDVNLALAIHSFTAKYRLWEKTASLVFSFCRKSCPPCHCGLFSAFRTGAVLLCSPLCCQTAQAQSSSICLGKTGKEKCLGPVLKFCRSSAKISCVVPCEITSL